MCQKNKELTEEERKWNLLWDNWAQGGAASPYAELMEYDSEVNNGGHFQYFLNGSLCGDVKEKVEHVLNNLPQPLYDNLKKAYDVFGALEDVYDLQNFERFIQYDKILYENEELLVDVLKQYVDSLSL